MTTGVDSAQHKDLCSAQTRVCVSVFLMTRQRARKKGRNGRNSGEWMLSVFLTFGISISDFRE